MHSLAAAVAQKGFFILHLRCHSWFRIILVGWLRCHSWRQVFRYFVFSLVFFSFILFVNHFFAGSFLALDARYLFAWMSICFCNSVCFISSLVAAELCHCMRTHFCVSMETICIIWMAIFWSSYFFQLFLWSIRMHKNNGHDNNNTKREREKIVLTQWMNEWNEAKVRIKFPRNHTPITNEWMRMAQEINMATKIISIWLKKPNFCNYFWQSQRTNKVTKGETTGKLKQTKWIWLQSWKSRSVFCVCIRQWIRENSKLTTQFSFIGKLPFHRIFALTLSQNIHF